MRVLVLGGTVFVGRHVVEEALGRGHEVTLFNRGLTNPELFPDVEKLRGDRDGDLSALQGRGWDAAIDTSGYVPRVVRASAELLADAVEHYTFISTISVYSDTRVEGVDESGDVCTVDDPSTETIADAQSYGALKALSEQAAEEVMPGRVLAVRPGLVVGPGDPTGRFTYWVHRIAKGGDVLAPEPRDQRVQLIDVRDLAEWILAMAETRRTGLFNATGPAERLTMGGLLEEVVDVTGRSARLVWVAEEFLVANGVEYWSDLPLWLAPASNEQDRFFLALSVEKAIAAGLRFRPLADTIRSTLEQAATVPGVGLDRAREDELLAAWHRRAA